MIAHLTRLLKQQGHLSFIQVGANDGVRSDPINKFVLANHQYLHGLVLEPLPDAFQALCKTYKDCPTIVPMQLAIHTTLRTMTLWRVNPAWESKLPRWVFGIASFDPDRYKLSGQIPAEAMQQVEVPCVPLESLLDDDLDFLQIDTEGYDADIVLALTTRPKIIHFEHVLLPKALLAHVLTVLHTRGYSTTMEKQDVLAVLDIV